MRLKTWRRFATAAAVLSIAVAVALAGGASTGQASTGFTIHLTPLIGTTTQNVIEDVTFGGKIGYHLFVQNTGDSTTPHVQILITSDSAAFFDTSNPNCAVNPNNANQLVCTPPGGTLAPNDTFDVDARFTAPASGLQVTTTASITVAAKTVGGKNNGTTLASSDPVLTNLTAGGNENDTFLRKTESAETGNLSVNHLQKFGVSLPGTLLGDPFGVALSIHDEQGTALCDTCLPSFTTLTIPDAANLLTGDNPFYNGIDPIQPYPWSMSAKYPSGFKLTGIIHDGHQLVTCESLGGAPTTLEPLCYFAASLQTIKSSHTVEGSGLGLENGNFGFN